MDDGLIINVINTEYVPENEMRKVRSQLTCLFSWPLYHL